MKYACTIILLYHLFLNLHTTDNDWTMSHAKNTPKKITNLILKFHLMNKQNIMYVFVFHILRSVHLSKWLIIIIEIVVHTLLYFTLTSQPAFIHLAKCDTKWAHWTLPVCLFTCFFLFWCDIAIIIAVCLLIFFLSNFWCISVSTSVSE